MKIKTIVKLMGLTTPFILTTACSTHTPKWQEESKDYEKENQKFKDLRGQMHPDDLRVVEFNSGYYVDKTPIPIIKDKKELPTIFYKKIDMFTPDPLKFSEFSAEVFKKTGLMIKFIDNSSPSLDNDKSKVNAAVAAMNNFNTPANLAVPPSSTAPYIQTPFGAQNPQQANTIIDVNNVTAEGPESIILDFNGNLKDLLDYVAVKKNLKWKYDVTTGKVFFYPFETQTFTIFAVAEDINMNSTITTDTSNDSSASSNGSSSSDTTAKNQNKQEIVFKQEQKYWEDVSTTIKGMLSADGRVNLNKTQGKVTVTDNDYNISQIKNYVDDLNKDAYKQVTIDFKIVNLKLDDKRDIGINMNIINDKLSLGFGNAAITAENGLNALSWKNGSGDSILLNVLDSLGQVKVDTNISVVTANNMPVPVQVTQNQAYIKERSIESTSNSNNNTDPIETITTDTVSQGVTATITPKAIGQNILLNYSMNLAVIDSLETAPGDSKIQLPITSTKNFVQRLTLRNGEAKVIAAFEKTDTKTGSTHPLNVNLWFLGGQETMTKQKEIILLVATPYISTMKQ